jgi:hypothetical protein
MHIAPCWLRKRRIVESTVKTITEGFEQRHEGYRERQKDKRAREAAGSSNDEPEATCRASGTESGDGFGGFERCAGEIDSSGDARPD